MRSLRKKKIDKMRERKKNLLEAGINTRYLLQRLFRGGDMRHPLLEREKKILILFLFFSQVLHERGKGQLSLVALISQGGASFNFR